MMSTFRRYAALALLLSASGARAADPIASATGEASTTAPVGSPARGGGPETADAKPRFRGEGHGRAWWAPLPERGWLGVRLGSREQLEQALKAETLAEEWQKVLNTRWLLEDWDGVGALVSQVFPDTPAEKAGLLPGDVVLSFNGIRTGSAGELSFVVQRALKGHDGDVSVLRDGEVRRILVEIGLHPEDARRLEEEAAAKKAEQARTPGAAPASSSDSSAAPASDR